MKHSTKFILTTILNLAFLLGVLTYTVAVGRASLVSPSTVLSVIQK